MKNFILSIAAISVFAACNSSAPKDENREIRLLADTTSYQTNFYADTSAAVAPAPVPATAVKAKPRVVTVRERIIYKQAPATPVYQPPVTAPASTPVPTTPLPSTTDNGDDTVQTGNGTTVDNQTASTGQETEKKKGWSSAKKGAVIGAGAGAIGGAIIAKKKGLGAIVGGVVGAAGGYIIGKDMDKRNNRLIAE
ncbi:MAG: glycine zipper domain-containing protein [Ginsengibacter sp.]